MKRRRQLLVRKPTGVTPLAEVVNEELNACDVTRRIRKEAAWPMQFLYQAEGMRGLQSRAARDYGVETQRRYGRTFVVIAVEGDSGARAALVFAPGMKEGAAEAVLIGCCLAHGLARGSIWADLVVRASVLDGSYFDESGDLE